jgi:excinuclease ABC subunit B
MSFKLRSKFKPEGDQPQAIEKLLANLKNGVKHQTLLGVTGSGKTFTMANVIAKIQKPTLVISHNKTLAAQLCSEFQTFFPENAVHYFVSYYDYYQPEAYIPHTDTYIAKDAQINDEIDRLRHAATSSLLTRPDVIICASVSCIYNLGSPEDYKKVRIVIKRGEKRILESVLSQLINIKYSRNNIDFRRGTFRVRGDVLEVFPAGSVGETIKIDFFGDEVEKISQVDFLTGKVLKEIVEIEIFPAAHYIAPKDRMKFALTQIKEDMELRVAQFKKEKKILEAQRLSERTRFDLEMICETGFCHGIENYSRYFDGRRPDEPPFALIDYYPSDFLLIIDESHMTVPQIFGMYFGDKSRKDTLIRYGFRLPSAADNRPLKFSEFEKKINQTIFVSATPGPYEFKKSQIPTTSLRGVRLRRTTKQSHITRLEHGIAMLPRQGGVARNDIKKKRANKISTIVEQLVRPTGLLDPTIEIKPTKNQIDDLINKIQERVNRKERVLVTTLTKRLAENLTEYLADLGIKVQYLHSEIETLDRLEILRNLRLGVFDVVVGINLLREGLDLPEVSLVAILDADKEGYLRSDTALIQTMGRASRHVHGHVVMYADKMTDSMRRAIDETRRRRKIQEEYNKKHNITPRSIKKIIPEFGIAEKEFEAKKVRTEVEALRNIREIFAKKDLKSIREFIRDLENQMDLAAKNLEFEKAAALRDKIIKIKRTRKAGESTKFI